MTFCARPLTSACNNHRSCTPAEPTTQPVITPCPGTLTNQRCPQNQPVCHIPNARSRANAAAVVSVLAHGCRRGEARYPHLRKYLGHHSVVPQVLAATAQTSAKVDENDSYSHSPSPSEEISSALAHSYSAPSRARNAMAPHLPLTDYSQRQHFAVAQLSRISAPWFFIAGDLFVPVIHQHIYCCQEGIEIHWRTLSWSTEVYRICFTLLLPFFGEPI